MRNVSLNQLFILAALAVAVFFVQLGSARLWDRDEPRNSRASHEMLQRGDWIVPTFNGQLRDHKPILLYWAQMASYLALGESEFSARLPSALCALLTVLATGILASRLAGCPNGIHRSGYWAAGALATSLLFVMAGRAATPDGCLIAFSTLGIACLVCASIAPALPYSSGSVAHAKWLPAAFGYLMLGLAALAKGPVGIVLPLAVVHVWWMICHRLQQPDYRPAPSGPNSTPTGTERVSKLGHVQVWLREAWMTFNPMQCLRALWALKTIPGLLLCLAAAAPWYYAVGVETDGAFLRGFFLEHNLGRAVNSMEGHRGSIFFYPLTFLIGLFPWSLWLIPIGLWARIAWRSNALHRQMIVLGSVWIAVYIAAFSMASTKLPSYITPCYPGAALIVGGFWCEFEARWSLPSWNWRRAAYGLTIGVGITISLAIVWLSQYEQMPWLTLVAVSGLAIAAMAWLAVVWDTLARTDWIPMTWLVGSAAFQILLFGLGATLVDRYRGDLALLESLKEQSHDAQWISIGGLEPSWVHYLDQEIIEVSGSPADSKTPGVLKGLLRSNSTAYVIVAGGPQNHPLIKLLQDDFGLRPVARGHRFLKSGELQVFSTQTKDEGISRIAERPGQAALRP